MELPSPSQWERGRPAEASRRQDGGGVAPQHERQIQEQTREDGARDSALFVGDYVVVVAVMMRRNQSILVECAPDDVLVHAGAPVGILLRVKVVCRAARRDFDDEFRRSRPGTGRRPGGRCRRQSATA